jgi:2-polyprenyl-3-methyl-5-hydroxy-6-metoxy-1,4-benzoquinol methylase
MAVSEKENCVKYRNITFDPLRLRENDIDRIQLGMIPENSRVLEIGCATGYMSGYLRNHKGCQIVGVEKSKAEALEAVSHCDLLFRGAIDDESLQREIDLYIAEYGLFDVVFMSQVIEHIAFPCQVLVKVGEWLTEEGMLVVSTVNVAHWKSRLRLLAGKWEYNEYGLFDSTHLRFFTPKTLRTNLEKAGFRIVEEGHSLDDITPFPFMPGIKLVTPANVLGVIPMFGKKLRRWYASLLKNIISNQFVYKCVKSHGDTV